MKTKSSLPAWGTLLFVTGFSIGILFLVIALWADYEAMLFDPANGASSALKSIHCPVIISPYEKGVARATIRNDTDRERTRRVQAHISAGYVSYMKEYLETVTLGPGKERTLGWEFESQDAAWDFFVLVRITLFGNPPQPSQTGSCGVAVINILGLPGKTITFLAVALSLGLMAAGLGRQKRLSRNRDVQHRRPSAIVFAALIAVGMAAVLVELWLLGVVALLAIVLLGVIAFANFALNAQRFS